MLDVWKQLTVSQFDAALSTLSTCIHRCPEDAWNAPVANLMFCQVAFHTLFFADCYLGPDSEAMRAQPFHIEYADYFRDYEEMEDRPRTLRYDRGTTVEYVGHCQRKAAEVVAAETETSLSRRSGFSWLPVSRAEVYPYNTRHIQHHAAQLSLRLRLDHGIDIPWALVGWRD